MLYVLCGFLVGVMGVVPGTAVKAFPAAVRFSGLSYSYHVAYAIFGGLTPLFVTRKLSSNRMAPAHYVLGMSVLGVLIGIYLWRRDHQRKPR